MEQLLNNTYLGTLPDRALDILCSYLCNIDESTGNYWLMGQPHSPCYTVGNSLNNLCYIPHQINDCLVWYRFGQRHRIGGPAVIWADSTRIYYEHGKIHRSELCTHTGLDLPAIERADGSQEWYRYGLRHRETIDPSTGEILPAMIRMDTRDPGEGPQYEEQDWGGEGWIIPEAPTRPKNTTVAHNGCELRWYYYGQIHRIHPPHNISLPRNEIDQPAIIKADGSRHYYQFGKQHREITEDGTQLPAVIHLNGTLEWWLNGERKRLGGGPVVEFSTGQTYHDVVTMAKRTL